MTVDARLTTLESKGLIELAASHPELEYLFRHWLVQDAAYGSLLKQERRELHRLVGEAIEELYPDRRGELAAVLARHFEQSGETSKALEYLMAAGTFALERNAFLEAYEAYGRAASLLPPPAAGEAAGLRRLRVEVALGRSRAGWSFLPSDALIEGLEAILPAADELGDLDLLVQVHLSIALARLQRGDGAADPDVARSLDRVEELGETLDDPSLRALALAVLGLMQVFTGPIREGTAALEEAVPHLEKRRDFIGAAFARGALAIGYANLGEFEKAETAADNAIRLAAEGGDLIAQLDAQIAASMVHAARGELEEAAPLAQACMMRAEETGATACVVASSWVLGDVYQRQGRLQDARQTLEVGHDIAVVVDRKVWRPTLQAWLGATAAALGDSAAAAGTWDELLKTARSIGNRYGEAGILRKRAEAAAVDGDAAAALEDYAASAAILEELGARPDLARVLRSQGELLRAGERARGDETLRRALSLFEEMGIDREAAEVRAALAVEPAASAG